MTSSTSASASRTSAPRTTIVEAAKAALDRGEHGYTPAAGIPPLRQAVAADLKRRHGADIDPDRVLITPGAKPVMYFSIMLFGEPGAEIMYPNPGFPIYESVINFTGATAVPIELHESTGFSFSADEVLSKVTDRTRLIILNSPSNPTGGVVPAEEIDKLVEGLEAYPDAVILSDEVYSWILYGGREHVSLLNYPQIRDRLVLLEGWSKTYAMTGWRIGYGVFPAHLFPHVETPRRQLLLLRQRCYPARRDRRPRGPRRQHPRDGQGVRRTSRADRPRAQHGARLHLRGPRRRPSTRSRTSRALASTPSPSSRSSSRSAASPSSPAPASATWARATSASPTPPAPRTSPTPSAGFASC